MIESERKIGPFLIREIWFSEDVFDIEDIDAVEFNNTTFSGNRAGFSKKISKTVVIDLSKSIEDIWNSMDRKSCSHQIAKALDDDFVIKFNERYSEFSEISRDFRNFKRLPPVSISPDEMKKNYFLVTYEKNGTVMGGHLCLKDNRRIMQVLSANRRNSDNGICRTDFCRANRLAIWETIRYSKEEGLEEFDFGGYFNGKLGDELNGLNRFKMSFGGRICDKLSYSRIYSRSYSAINSVHSTAISVCHKINEPVFYGLDYRLLNLINKTLKLNLQYHWK